MALNYVILGQERTSAWEDALKDFATNGIITVSGEGENTALSTANAQIQNILKEYRAIAETKGGLGLKKEGGYRELVQKDEGRFDLNLDHLIPEKKHNIREYTETENAISNIFEYIEKRLRTVLSDVLTDQYVVNAFGAVVSHPNTTAQRWHVDSSHLFQVNSLDAKEANLPCHFVTVFCPLYEFSEAIGPTEVALATQKRTAILANRTVEDQYPDDSVVASILSGKEVQVMKINAKVGDIIVMDGRTLHRGTSNLSTEIRPLMYLSFSRPWYYEFPRSQNDGRSLFQ
jgi:ectoine hydroxylase-related dioxygenase (phytanoyl-CoA dioxygenase family)